jgi:hypothetical protein
MNRKILGLTVVLFLTLACGLTAPATPPQSDVATVVAETFQALTANAPTPKPSGISIAFQNVSFIIPEGLASGATSELVPAADESSGGPWGVAPQHISFQLTNYNGRNDSFFNAEVNVYPMAEYAAANSWAAGSITRLQAVLSSPNSALTNETLPAIPSNGAAAQQYAAQAKLISFNGGKGVRMISQYAQFPAPISKDNSLFHYEGLTSDGKYLVTVLFPVYLPLQATTDNPSADGIPFPSDPMDTAGMIAYYQGVTDKLNAASSESFQPSLTQLDALIQSITVSAE